MQEKLKHKRMILSGAIGKTIKKYRENTGKSITLISDEINLSKTIWADAEKGIVDVQSSTLYRIVEALDIKHEDFMVELKKNLPKNFSFED